MSEIVVLPLKAEALSITIKSRIRLLKIDALEKKSARGQRSGNRRPHELRLTRRGFEPAG